jgi:hypothetical protein
VIVFHFLLSQAVEDIGVPSPPVVSALMGAKAAIACVALLLLLFARQFLIELRTYGEGIDWTCNV